MTTIEETFTQPSLDEVQGEADLVVVDFSATWCGPCKRYDPVFHRMAKNVKEEDADLPVAFLVVDVDENKALARELGVRSVPTTVIVAREHGLIPWGKRWREKKRFSGVIPYPRLRQAVDEQLELLS